MITADVPYISYFLHLLVIDEISLVGNIMLSFIDYRLQIIKQVHNQFIGGIDVCLKFMDFFIQKHWN